MIMSIMKRTIAEDVFYGGSASLIECFSHKYFQFLCGANNSLDIRKGSINGVASLKSHETRTASFLKAKEKIIK